MGRLQDGGTTLSLPKVEPDGVIARTPETHTCIRFYQSLHYRIINTVIPPLPSGDLVTARIKCTSKHSVYPNHDYCRLQECVLDAGHAAYPPEADVVVLFWWFKINVEMLPGQDLGGNPTGEPRAIVQHWTKCNKRRRVFGISLSDVQSVGKGLYVELKNCKGLIETYEKIYKSFLKMQIEAESRAASVAFTSLPPQTPRQGEVKIEFKPRKTARYMGTHV